MSNTPLIEAVKGGEFDKTQAFLEAGHDVTEQGTEQDWPPLNHAAGQGNLEMISLLLEKSANVFGVGRDRRTPYTIALAAGHVKACELLHEAEERAGGDTWGISSRAFETRPYCKAYSLGALREFTAWNEKSVSPKKDGESDSTQHALTNDSIVFVHQDFTVTKSMWWNEDVLYDNIADSWIEFCKDQLQFSVPHDFELVGDSE